MAQKINLKEVERKAWRSFYQDGLWDIFLGLLLLAWAIGALISDTGMSELWVNAVYLVLFMLAFVVIWAGKKFITVPRMGRVKFGPKGKARLSWVVVIFVISALLGVIVPLVGLAVRSNPPGWLNSAFFFPAAWVVNMLVVFGVGAYFLDFNRLYLIGVLYALPVPLEIMQRELSSIDLTFVAFGLPAAVILLMGAVVFVRFLRDYPLPTGGALDGST